MRAALYMRISQDRTGEAAGVRRQEEDCRALAAELGWDVAESYIDNDKSATSGKPRPAFRRMLADIEAGRVSAIVAWHTDRLYRRLEDLSELIPICEKHHIVIRTCRAGEVDLSTPTGKLLARILGSFAVHEGEQKADRWKRSYRQRREAGQVYRSGPRHFGYERDGTIREAEADTIRWLAGRVLDGDTIHSLCQQLGDKGITTSLGNTWRAQSLRLLLNSPRLAGLVVHGGEVLPGVVGEWEPILDRITWERVVAALDPKRGRAAPARRALLSGLIYCGMPDCGRKLYRSARRGRPIYTCKKDPNQACGHIAVMAAPVEEMVEGYARERLTDPKVRRFLAAHLSTGAAENVADLLADVEAQIRDLEAELRIAGSGRSASAIRRAIDDLDGQATVHRDRLGTLTPVRLPDGDGDWPTDLGYRASLIGIVVDRVTVGPALLRGARFDASRITIVPAVPATD